MFKWLIGRVNNNRGSITILMAIALLALVGVMAYVIDVGIIYAEGIKLSNAIDAAALAGGMELLGDPDAAVEVANQYLVDNGVDLANTTLTIGEDNLSLDIESNKEVPHYFATVFGVDNSMVTRNARVQLGAAKSVKGGIRPFAVEVDDFQYGDLVTMKQAAGDGNQGNYGYVALGGTGA